MKNRRYIELQLRALAGRKRMDIILFLRKNGVASSAKIAKEIRLSRPATSQHLMHLYDAGIVHSLKRGSFVTYRLSLKQSKLVKGILADL